MVFTYNKFLKALGQYDRTISILDDYGNVVYTINPFDVYSTSISDKYIVIALREDQTITLEFSNLNEVKLAIPLLDGQITAIKTGSPYIDTKVTNTNTRYSWDKFLRELSTTDRYIQVLTDDGIPVHTINPWAVYHALVNNNILEVAMRGGDKILLPFSSNYEAKLALERFQIQLDTLRQRLPYNIDKEIEQYIEAKFQEYGIFKDNGSGLLVMGRTASLTEPLFELQNIYEQTIFEVSGEGQFTLNSLTSSAGATAFNINGATGSSIFNINTSGDTTVNNLNIVSIEETTDEQRFLVINNLGDVYYQTAGIQGNQGFQGFQGFQGWQGFQGLQGTDGYIGEQGNQGFQGSQGWQGFQGNQGVQGLSGSITFTFEVVGVTGSQGFQGNQGLQGYQGWQGLQGLQGTDGYIGEQGNQGFQGWQGFQGNQGHQGLQGYQGNQGWQGLQGNQGWQGATGTFTGYTLHRISGSFSGLSMSASPTYYYDVVFPSSFTASYVVNIESDATRLFTVTNKTLSGFTIESNSITSFTDVVYWEANDLTAGDFGAFVGLQGPTGSTGPKGIPTTLGNTLTVDSVYGNDTEAALDRNSTQFKTIGAALLSAIAGDIVIVNAGVYNETIVMPDNVSLQGVGAQSVIIQKLGVTQDTTLITMGINCRVENFTANLSSSGNYNLTGVDFPSGTSINAKLRNSIWTITSTATGSPNIIGVKSSGTSSTTYSAANAIQRSTINVISSSTGVSRGILVDGPNRFAVRDIVIYARGTGTNVVGFETNHASAVGEIKTSTVSGSLYDVNRSLGTLVIGATDLLNNTANGNSFTPTQAPASFQFGVVNSLGNNRRYYLLPGTVAVGTLTSEIKTDAYNPALGFPIPIIQPSLVISLIITFTANLAAGEAVTINLYKNTSTTPSMSLTLNSGEGQIKTLDTESFSITTGDVIIVTLETTGDPGAGAFSAIVGYY